MKYELNTPTAVWPCPETRGKFDAFLAFLRRQRVGTNRKSAVRATVVEYDRKIARFDTN
jgi:hypothetical protein